MRTTKSAHSPGAVQISDFRSTSQTEMVLPSREARYLPSGLNLEDQDVPIALGGESRDLSIVAPIADHDGPILAPEGVAGHAMRRRRNAAHRSGTGIAGPTCFRSGSIRLAIASSRSRSNRSAGYPELAADLHRLRQGIQARRTAARPVG